MPLDDENFCAECSITDILDCCNQLPLDGGVSTDVQYQTKIIKWTRRDKETGEEVFHTKHRVCEYLTIERVEDRSWQAYCTAPEHERPSRCNGYRCEKFYDIEE